MRDVIAELNAIQRVTGRDTLPAGEARTVVLRRRYDAPIDDVWNAITTPERIKRWFLPISGDLRLGGRYQLEGNAGGEIRHCEQPTLLVVTWVYTPQPSEEDISEVRVRLTPDGDATHFELTHTAIVPDERWQEFGPGAVGVGWDSALLGLSLHLACGAVADHGIDPHTWPFTPEGRGFLRGSSEKWGAALREGGATEEAVATAVTNTSNFYAPDQA